MSHDFNNANPFPPGENPFGNVPKPPPKQLHPKLSGMAVGSLILAFISLVFSCLTGIVGVILGVVALFQIGKSNGHLTGRIIAVAGIVLSILFSMVVPAFMFPGILAVRSIARDVEASHKMRDISRAMTNYESAVGKLPEDIYSPDGTPLLSWRVAVLPFLETNLKDEFHLDEPWDSPHNLALVERIPDIYNREGVELQSGYTLVKRPQGNGALFDAPVDGQRTRGVRFESIKDGGSNTIMLVETRAEVAVPWTKPADYEYEPTRPFKNLGARENGMINLITADSSVMRIAEDYTKPELLNSAFTRDGGESFSIREIVDAQPGQN